MILCQTKRKRYDFIELQIAVIITKRIKLNRCCKLWYILTLIIFLSWYMVLKILRGIIRSDWLSRKLR